MKNGRRCTTEKACCVDEILLFKARELGKAAVKVWYGSEWVWLARQGRR